jgi:hypothetical protein
MMIIQIKNLSNIIITMLFNKYPWQKWEFSFSTLVYREERVLGQKLI